MLIKGSAGPADARDGSGMMGGLSFALLLNSQLLATTAFMFVVPFMPLYVQQLGVEDAGHAAAWAGFINGASGATMALIAPLWGILSDRLGRKIMLLRATLAAAFGLAWAPRLRSGKGLGSWRAVIAHLTR